MWIDSKGTLTPDQQQFNSTLRVAPYTSAGKDVIYAPGYYKCLKPRARAKFHGVQSQSSSSVRAGEDGSPMVVQPAKRVTKKSVDGEAFKSIDGIKKGEALNNNCADVEGTLQLNQEEQQISDSISTLSPPINAPNSKEVNMESRNLILNSVSEAELFDIQIREIDEALKAFGNNSEFKEIPTAVINSQSNSPVKQVISDERERARQVGTRATRGKKFTTTTNEKKKRAGGQGEGSRRVGNGEKKLWEAEGSVSSGVTK